MAGPGARRCVCGPWLDAGPGVLAGLHESLVAEAGAVPLLRQRLRAWLDEAGTDVETREDIVLAVNEAVANVVDHACPDRPCTVELAAGVRPCQPGIVVRVSDDGIWRSPPTDPGARGRGVQMMVDLASRYSMDTRDDGTTVSLCWTVSTRVTTAPALPGPDAHR